MGSSYCVVGVGLKALNKLNDLMLEFAVPMAMFRFFWNQKERERHKEKLGLVGRQLKLYSILFYMISIKARH